MMNSPLSWMGGKYRLRKRILEHFPQDYKCYIEVFGGAAWVLFGKDPSQVEVYNDINSDLVNFFRILKHHPEEFEKWIKKDIVSREIFEEYKDIPGKYLTDIQRAIRFYYIIKYSFASKGDVFGYGTTKSPNSGIFNISYVEEVRDRLRSCYIEHLPFKKIFEKYDNSHSFFYCDPPYYELTQYKDKFYKKDHLELVEALKGLEGKFLITINDHPEVREWYKDFNVHEVEVGYSISRQKEARKKYKELIITNYVTNKTI